MKHLKIGTRGSRLSLVQTHLVLNSLKDVQEDLQFDVVTIKTKGDTDARPLYTIDRKGIFEKEIDSAVIDGRVEFAVHSLKDLPSILPEGLTIASIPKRESPNDVLVSKDHSSLKEIRAGAVVGTSSLRRAVQIQALRPDLTVKPIRGNVETRVRKIEEGEFDSIVLAEAGLKRLGMEEVIAERLNIEDFVPSPGQGAMAVVCREGDRHILDLLKKIDDEKSRTEVMAERALLLRINAGCRFPLGAIAISDTRSRLQLIARVYSIDGKEKIDVRRSGDVSRPEQVGNQVAAELEQRGAMKLALSWRDHVDKWSARE